MKVKKPLWWWMVFGLLCVWQMPQLIVFLLLCPFMGKKKVIAQKRFSFCIVAQKMRGGISLGPFCMISPNYHGRYLSGIIAHEFGHTVDSMILGPLYLFVIGIPSALNAHFGFTKGYYDFYTERLANRHAGLKVRGGILQAREEDSGKSKDGLA